MVKLKQKPNTQISVGPKLKTPPLVCTTNRAFARYKFYSITGPPLPPLDKLAAQCRRGQMDDGIPSIGDQRRRVVYFANQLPRYPFSPFGVSLEFETEPLMAAVISPCRCRDLSGCFDHIRNALEYSSALSNSSPATIAV